MLTADNKLKHYKSKPKDKIITQPFYNEFIFIILILLETRNAWETSLLEVHFFMISISGNSLGEDIINSHFPL